VKFGGEGFIKYFYYFVLISHITLSAVIMPMVLITLSRALKENFEHHKKIARITFPMWLYVSFTGVLVYVLISPYYI
jgi:putative membrane protein